MKVLHVAECIGGVDRYLRTLIKYSTCENVMVLSQLYKREEYEKIADSVEIMQMKHGMNSSAIKEALDLRKRIKNHNPDIVFAHSSTAGAIVRIACIGLKVKVIYNPHGWSFNMEGRRKQLFIKLEKIMSHFCDAIVCISEAEKQSALREHICAEQKLYVVYNGVDVEDYRIGDVELPFSDDAFIVGMVGRISRQKAPEIFVRMAGEVKKEIKNSVFVIVGDVIEGALKERQEIEELALKLGINLYITGWVNNPLDYIAKFDVGCLLSRWEGFGLAIPEYMMVGTPIIATNVDAIPNLITDQVNGLLVEKDDWKSAASYVIELACCREKRMDLINNGKETVKKRFNARRVSTECEKIYEELVL